MVSVGGLCIWRVRQGITDHFLIPQNGTVKFCWFHYLLWAFILAGLKMKCLFYFLDVQWKCDADMSSYYQFGRIEVVCEGYDYPDDP